MLFVVSLKEEQQEVEVPAMDTQKSPWKYVGHVPIFCGSVWESCERLLFFWANPTY